MSYFETGNKLGFYLQDYYAADWVNNSMIFLEVDDVDQYWQELVALRLDTKYPEVRLVPVQDNDWGKECFIYDPSGPVAGRFKMPGSSPTKKADLKETGFSRIISKRSFMLCPAEESFSGTV